MHSGQNLNFKPREASGTSQFSKEGSNWVSTATENFNGKCGQPCKTGRQGPLLPYPLPLFSPSPAPLLSPESPGTERGRQTKQVQLCLPCPPGIIWLLLTAFLTSSVPVGQGWGWGGQVGRGTRETEGRAEETRFGKAAKNREPRCLLWKTNFPGCLAC